MQWKLREKKKQQADAHDLLILKMKRSRSRSLVPTPLPQHHIDFNEIESVSKYSEKRGHAHQLWIRDL